MQFTIFRSAFHDQAQFLSISFLGFPLTGAEKQRNRTSVSAAAHWNVRLRECEICSVCMGVKLSAYESLLRELPLYYRIGRPIRTQLTKTFF